MIIVVNKYKHKRTDHDVIIGRPSALGNPYTHKQTGTIAKYIVKDVDTACEKYAEYLRAEVAAGNPAILAALEKIKGLEQKHGEVFLLCYCKPGRCHGDEIKKYLEHGF